MKANNELILKYLSGLLEGKEKIDFEKKLNSSSQFRDEFETVSGRLSGMKEIYSAGIDERYFTNIMPNFRDKLGRRSRYFYFRKFAYVFPVALLLFVMTLYLPWPNGNMKNMDFTEMVNQAVAGSDSSDLSFNIYDTFDQNSWSGSETENPFDVVIPDHWDIQADNYAGVVDAPVIDELNKLPNEKLELLYKNLASLK